MAFTAVVFEGFGVTGGFVTLGFNVVFTVALGVGDAFGVIFGEGLTEALDCTLINQFHPRAEGMASNLDPVTQ